MDRTERFAELVRRPEPTIPLDEVGLVIAAQAHPWLEVAEGLARFDELAAQVLDPTLDGLRRVLFRDLGFSGNEAHYYDPRNSYLDDVLERRVGIPISLAVVTMEVGRRLGVPLWGVSMPGHFLLRDKVDPEVFVDPFAGGLLLDRRGCRLRFHGVHGADAVFDETFLEPVGRLAIVDRMLANLEGIATRTRQPFMLDWVLRLRALLPTADQATQRRRDAAHAAMQAKLN